MTDLSKKGFKRKRPAKLNPRLIMSISALEKQGKTHFALTAPGPIAMFSTDIGEEGVVEKFLGDKEVHVKQVTVEEDQDKADESWEDLKESYTLVLESPSVRTIIADTATDWWELIRLAKFGRTTQVMPYMYGPVNAEFRKLIKKAYDYDKNLILLHKMKPKYIEDKRTKEYERSGFGDMGFLVQVNAELYRYSKEDGGEFAIYIRDCRQNPDLAEEEFTGPMCNFPFVASMVLPDVDPKEWE